MAGTFLSVSAPLVVEAGTDAVFTISVFQNYVLATPATISLKYRDAVTAPTTVAPTLVTVGNYTRTIAAPTLPGSYNWTVTTTTPNLTSSGEMLVIATKAA